jgi:presenilin-like A22 family membrane protease
MRSKLGALLWGGLFMVLAVALTLYVASLEKVFVEVNQIPSPNVSLPPILIYFFGVVVAVALVLFFIPLRWLKAVFRTLFTLMFAWGVFIVAFLALPWHIAYILALAAIAGLAWRFWARVWLHDLLLVVTLAGAGAVFGYIVSPWTFLAFMLVVAVYDVLAVRFGFMVWMAGRLSESVSLPAFIFPKQIGDWGRSLKTVSFGELKEKAQEEREHAVLGGGDIGFPLMLSVSVFFKTGTAGLTGMASAILVGGFALVGLLSAFLIQISFLKGKPMPALPPIAFFSIIGFLLAPIFFG